MIPTCTPVTGFSFPFVLYTPNIFDMIFGGFFSVVREKTVESYFICLFHF
jgi:hypothetical protein